jgi:hypothetical protein
MRTTLYAIGAAALLAATAVQAADAVPGSVGSQPGAPIQSFGASPGMPGAGGAKPSFGAQPGAPGSPSYQPNSALPSLGNQGSAVAPEAGTSASGFNMPNSSSGTGTSSGALGNGGTSSSSSGAVGSTGAPSSTGGG